jgi:hypothetical protein
VAVEAAQAGQEVLCACGERIEVPTLQGLRKLPVADAVPATHAPGVWGPRQQTALAGAVVTVIAAVLAGYLYWQRPRMLDPESLPPRMLWTIWHHFRQGVDHPLPGEIQYLIGMRVFWRWMMVVGSLALIGIAIMASSLLVPRRSQSPGKKSGSDLREPGPP